MIKSTITKVPKVIKKSKLPIIDCLVDTGLSTGVGRNLNTSRKVIILYPILG